MITIRIPPTLRTETEGESTVQANGETVRDLLDDLTGRFPALRERIYPGGELARFVNVYVEGEDVRTREGLETPVADSSTVILLPAMAGGSLASLTEEGYRPAEPASALLSARRPQDAAPSALVRASWHCPARRGLASFADERSGNRGDVFAG